MRLLAVHRNFHVGRAEGVSLNLGEVPRTNSPLKKDINFSGAETLWFRESEKRPYKRKEAESAPNKAAFSFQVPSGRVENRWVEEIGNDAGDIVAVSSQNYTLDTETCRWDLRDEAIADGSDRKIVSEDEDHKQAAGSPAQSNWTIFGNSHKSDSYKDRKHDSQSIKIERSAPYISHDKPRAHGATEAECVLAYTKVERFRTVKSGLLFKIPGSALLLPERICGIQDLNAARQILRHKISYSSYNIP